MNSKLSGGDKLPISEDMATTSSKISAYARLDFDNFTFFVQTLHLTLGRKSNLDIQLQSNHHAVDVHLLNKKAVSRKHARLFYNFASQQFELSVEGRNGAFVDDVFIDKGNTVPLIDGTKVQIGDIPFIFVLPSIDISSKTQFNPTDAVNLRLNLYSKVLPTTEVVPVGPPDSKLNSYLKLRRMSNSRRKSLATVAGDELNDILKELGVSSIDAIDDDSSILDTQIQSVLGDNDIEADLSKYDIDDIDTALTNINNTINQLKSDSVNGKVINSYFLSQLEMKRSNLLQKKHSNQKGQSNMSKPSFGGPASNLSKPFSGPRMGKPAAPIQPLSSRLYSNTNSNKNINIPIDSRLLHQKVGNNSLQYPYHNNNIPRSKLEVPVLTITTEPSTIRFRPPLRAITTSYDPPLEAFGIPTTTDEPSKYPKIPMKKNFTENSKRVYSIDEIPEQFRIKPLISISAMVSNVLKLKNNESGLTLNEIYDAIKDMYPYYHYCVDGWQSSISHNVKYNKLFKKLLKKGDEWSYVIDDLFINEREKVRSKQQEFANSTAKSNTFKVEDKLKPNYGSRNFSQSPNSYKPGSQYGSASTSPYNSIAGPKPKTIAELASEIRRDGLMGSSAPMYFKPQSTMPPNSQSGTSSPISPTENNIKAQLAANRSNNKSHSPGISQSPINSQPLGNMNQDTIASLTYLQKELFVLYKARKLKYDSGTTTEIITKALATTIAQVNAIGAKAGYGDNALSFLIEKAPKQVTKILDIALSKLIKEFEGLATSSRSGTPGPQNLSPTPQHQPQVTNESKDKPVLGKPSNYSSSRGLVRPSFNKPGALSRPPRYLSNKVSQPGFESQSEVNDNNKRELVEK